MLKSFNISILFGLNTILILAIFFSHDSQAQSFVGSRKPIPIARTYGYLGTLLDVGLYYSSSDGAANPASGNTWENSTALYDIKLGYIDESQIYYGAVYSARNDNQSTVEKVYGQSFGLGIGFFRYNGFNVRGYYKFNDYYGEYKDGSGYHLELGYAISPTSSFYVGLCYSFREINYKTNQSIVGFSSWTRKESYPFLTIGFLH